MDKRRKLIKKSSLPKKYSGALNMYMLRSGRYPENPFHCINFYYYEDRAWITERMDNRGKLILNDFFIDWQNPTLAEDTLFELETGYSLQKIFRVKIEEN